MSLNGSKITIMILQNIDILSFLLSKENISIIFGLDQISIKISSQSIDKIFTHLSLESEDEDTNSQLIKYISFIILPKCLTKTQYSIKSTEYECILLYVNLLHIHFGIQRSTLISAYSLKKICQMITLSYKAISPYIIVSIIPDKNQYCKGLAVELIKKNDNKQIGSVYSTIKSQHNLKDSFMSQNSSFVDYSDQQRFNLYQSNTPQSIDFKKKENEKEKKLPKSVRYYCLSDVKGSNHLVQLDYYNEYIDLIKAKTNFSLNANGNKSSAKDLHFILVDANKKVFRMNKSSLRPIPTFSNQDIWIRVMTTSGNSSLINLEEFELVKTNEEDIDMLDFYGNTVSIKSNQYSKLNSTSNQITKKKKKYVITFAKVYLRERANK